MVVSPRFFFSEINWTASKASINDDFFKNYKSLDDLRRHFTEIYSPNRMTNEQDVTRIEENVTSKEQKVISKSQTFNSNKQSNKQWSESNEQKVIRNEQIVKNKEQKGVSNE